MITVTIKLLRLRCAVVVTWVDGDIL